MLTKRDVVEAQAFDRRRLVTAFVCGARGGRQAESAGAGRTLVGGAALALLLVAAAAIASMVAPHPTVDWDKPGLLISEQTGERYLVTAKGAPLRPVANLTSAQLVLGAHPTPRIVAQRALDGHPLGAEIGIAGAPQRLPEESSFVESGWTACTANGAGISVDVARRPAVSSAPGRGVVVTADGTTAWVVADGPGHRAHRYRLPSVPGEDNVLESLGLSPQSQALRVPQAWLALFPAGGALGPDSFGLGDRAGQPLSYAGRPGIGPAARVGDVATVPSTGQIFLLTATGPALMDPFAAALYTTSAALAPDGPREAGTGGLPIVRQVPPTWAGAAWPTGVLRTVTGPVCAQLVATAGAAPAVLLASAPRGRAWTAPVAGADTAVADQGVGALVRSGRWSQVTSSSTWIVDERGNADPIADEQTLATLGLASYRAPLVPDAWIRVLGRGVPLSRARALCPPRETAKPGPQGPGFASGGSGGIRTPEGC